MIEVTVLNYLSEVLDVPVYVGEKPIKKPKEYVVLEVIDVGRINYIDATTFNISSYATTLFKAAELNEAVKEAMHLIVSEDTVSSSKLGGGGQNIDTESKEYCYESVFNIFYTE